MKSNIRGIMRSQVYQLVRTRNLRAVVLGLLALAVFFGASDKIQEGNGTTACLYFVQMLSMIMSLSMFGVATFTGFVCADDFTDKTANNELTSGRLRSESFIARAIVSVIGSVLLGLMMVLALLVTCFLIYPRGYELTNAAIVQRVLLMIPVFIRLSCFYVLVSYIVKKPIAVVGICYAMICVLGLILGMSGGGESSRLLTGFGSFQIVCYFEEWHTYGLNTDVYYVYEQFVDGGTAAALTAVSLAAGAVYLLLGYSFFHRDDIQ